MSVGLAVCVADRDALQAKPPHTNIISKASLLAVLDVFHRLAKVRAAGIDYGDICRHYRGTSDCKVVRCALVSCGVFWDR